MNRERHTFDPHSIQAALDRDLPGGLRAIADALEAGDICGKFISAMGHGFTSCHDTRAHVLVKIDLAAEVFQYKSGEKVALPAPTLELPAAAPRQLGTKGDN